MSQDEYDDGDMLCFDECSARADGPNPDPRQALKDRVYLIGLVEEMRETLIKADALITAMFPGVRHIALDYKALNETPLAIQAVLRKVQA